MSKQDEPKFDLDSRNSYIVDGFVRRAPQSIGRYLMDLAFNLLYREPQKGRDKIIDAARKITLPPLNEGEVMATMHLWASGKIWRMWNCQTVYTTDEMSLEEAVKLFTPHIVIVATDDTKPSDCTRVKPGQTGRYLGRFMGDEHKSYDKTLYVVRIYNDVGNWGEVVLVTGEEFEYY